MADFNWVNNRLATGAQIVNDADVQAILNAGVTHIIDTQAEHDDSALFENYPQVRYLWNPTADDGIHPKPTSWFYESIIFALSALAFPHFKVLAHCGGGRNRGPSTAFAIMVALGITPQDAEKSIRDVRPQVVLAYKDDAILAVKALGYV